MPQQEQPTRSPIPTVASFELHFTPLSDEPSTAKMAEQRFWAPFAKTETSQISPAQSFTYDNHVREKFALQLMELLLSEFKKVEKTDKTTPFLLSLGKVSYGSLTLLVFVTGVIDIVKFFDNNLDFLTAVLNLYAPVALSMVTTGDSRPRVSCTVAPSQPLRDAFAAAVAAGAVDPATANLPTAPTTTTGATVGREERLLQTMRLAALFSILLPVFLALWILYEAHQAAVQERAAFQERQADLIKAVIEERQHLLSGTQSLQERQNEYINILTNQAKPKTATPQQAPQTK